LCLFRIVQEGLQNAVKHGSARTVAVDLTGGPNGLTLTIVDDGVGFDVDARSAKGLGLISMEERLEPLGGTLEIHSRPGAGTRLHAFVPAPPTASR
jgi:signal transduction histidine kinase